MNWLTNVVRLRIRDIPRRETPPLETASKPAPLASALTQIVSAPEVAPTALHA